MLLGETAVMMKNKRCGRCTIAYDVVGVSAAALEILCGCEKREVECLRLLRDSFNPVGLDVLLT